ncbi:MAG: response regulator [Thermodesulfovibrionales bacterium]|nr:response regulator [Thermodesulfovibrionales bacterium]
MNEIEVAEKEFGILDHAPLGLFVLRQDFVVLFWNSCLEDWTGISRRDIIGTNISVHFPQLNSPEYYKRIQNIFEGGPPTIFSSQLHKYIIPSRLWDGQVRIQHTTVTSISAADGAGFNALFAIQDVTDLTHRIQGYRVMRDQALEEVKERKRAEDELRRAHEGLELRVKERTADLVLLNERLQGEIKVRKKVEEELKKLVSTLNTLVYHIPEGVALLDAEHRIVLANSIGEKYLEALAGSNIGDVLTDISGHSLEEFLVSASHKVCHELKIDSPSNFVFEIAGRTIVQNGVVGGMVLVLKDVTEERTLDDRVNSQERLAAVGQLAAGIAHDFNNILTGIIGFADILRTDYALPYEEKEMVEAILQNGERAAQLVRQILDFSSKSLSEIQSINLMPFLKELSKFIGRTIPENIEIFIDCKPGEYIIEGDAAKIQQVFTNLALNARDAMPDGGKLRFALSRISIEPEDMLPVNDMPYGDWIAINVTDTGTGIHPDTLPHIFEPFFTTKEVGKGTGLGLSQVYGIVKQHEGHIHVTTEVGKSTAFNIYLPASRLKAGTSFTEEEIVMPKGQKETILVVEDNESVRNLIHKKLSNLDYRVLTAINGKDALSIFKDNQNDIKLVITDLVMPEMGGIEMSKIVKATNPSVKIIALSGYSMGFKEEDLRKSGIEECMQKPFQSQKFIEVVSRVLERGPG